MKKAFTIVELLVFMGLFSVLIVVLTEIFTSALSLQLETEAVSSVEQDGRYILTKLMYDVNRAQAITLPTGSGGQGSILKLTIGGITYTYDLNAGNLRLNDGAINYLNGFNTTVSGFNVLHLGPGTSGSTYKDSVQIKFTLTSKVTKKSGQEIKNYQTTVGLR